MGGRMQRKTQGTAYQRGAVAIWVGLSMVAMVTAAFLAIETGRVYYTQRELQKLASMSATAGAQVASGCAVAGGTGEGKLASLDAVTTQVRNFIISNGGDPSYLTGINGFEPVELGTMVSQNNLRVFAPLPEGDPRISAVRVNLKRIQPTPFTGFLTGGKTLVASASAEQALSGSLSVGSTLLGLSGGLLNNITGALLCPGGDFKCQTDVISLNIASYATGLANTAISLGDLAIAAGVSVKDLSDPLALSTQTVIPSEFLNGLAGALSGRVSGGISSLLGNLAAAAAGNTQGVPLGNLLGAVTSVAGAVPAVNLLDMISALGAASHADPSGAAVVPIQLPVGVSVPGVATVTAYLRVLQSMQFSGTGRPGSTEAHTSQVKLQVRVSVANALLNTVKALLTTILGVLNAVIGVHASLDTLNLNIGIDTEVSPSTAYLDAIQCPTMQVNNGQPIASISATRSLASIAVGTFTGTATPTSAPPISTSGAGMDLIKLSISGVLGSGSLSVRMTETTVNAGGSTSPVPLTDVTQFERDTTVPLGTPAIYNALGGPGVQPVVAVAANPQSVSSPVNLEATVGVKTVTDGPPGLVSLLLNLVSTLVNSLLGLLQPVLALVNGLADLIINPLLEALGVQGGTATVTMNAVQIGRPEKVATCVPGGAGTNACPVATLN